MELNFSYQSLSYLPEAIGNLTQLERLYLHENQLHSLLDSIGNLAQLKLLI